MNLAAHSRQSSSFGYTEVSGVGTFPTREVLMHKTAVAQYLQFLVSVGRGTMIFDKLTPTCAAQLGKSMLIGRTGEAITGSPIQAYNLG